jgi:two-component system CheB/CheR fusion protein
VKRILIVDDHVDAATSMAMLIELMGHEVSIAYDGRSGIEAAQRLCPDVLLLDLGMPDMSGYEVVRRLRGDAAPMLAHMRIIALTGYGQASDRRMTQEAGFDHHLIKPVDPDQLEKLLRAEPASGDGGSGETATTAE